MMTSAKSLTQTSRVALKYQQVQLNRNYSPSAAKEVTKKRSSLRNSQFILSTVCKGLVLCPTKARHLSATIISKIKSHPIFNYVDDYPGQKSQEHGHEKILAEQQRQLEKLQKELKEKEGDEKFPKYKPKP